MGQINLRIPEEDYKILEFVAKRQNIPITSLFRMIINPTFEKWKIENIIKYYAEGGLRFKDAVKLSRLSFVEFLRKLEETGIEPPQTEEMELASEMIADTLSKDKLLKNPNVKRKTPPLP